MVEGYGLSDLGTRLATIVCMRRKPSSTVTARLSFSSEGSATENTLTRLITITCAIYASKELLNHSH